MSLCRIWMSGVFVPAADGGLNILIQLPCGHQKFWKLLRLQRNEPGAAAKGPFPVVPACTVTTFPAAAKSDSLADFTLMVHWELFNPLRKKKAAKFGNEACNRLIASDGLVKRISLHTILTLLRPKTSEISCETGKNLVPTRAGGPT